MTKKKETLPVIRELIIVEGRDDTRAVLRAVRAETCETHGFGMAGALWERIDRACASGRGIIVLTDPDRAGENIRKQVTARAPEAKQAYLPRAEAIRRGDIGVENASPEAIREALAKAHATQEDREPVFTVQDLAENGLSGSPEAAARREALGARLGIGYANAKTFLRRLNGAGITREEVHEALRAIDDPND